MFAGVQVISNQPSPANKKYFQSKLIPILEPEFVADQIISAVLTEREVLLLPWWSFLLIALKVNLTTSLLSVNSSSGGDDGASFHETQ